MEYSGGDSSSSLPGAGGHSMGSALVEHRSALLAVCVASLLASVPLAINMFWHLQARRVRTMSKSLMAKTWYPSIEDRG